MLSLEIFNGLMLFVERDDDVFFPAFGIPQVYFGFVPLSPLQPGDPTVVMGISTI